MLDPSQPEPPRPEPAAAAAAASEHDLLQEEQLTERRVLTWRQLDHPALRWRFWEQLWDDVCALRARYALPVRARWFSDEIQVEALAALASWVVRYDSGAWEDPPGKLSLLFELERVAALLRDGHDPLDPERDRADFEAHLARAGFGLGPGVR